MKKWMLFSFLAAIGCTILAGVFFSMAGPDLMKEYGQRATKIKINGVPFQPANAKLEAKDIDQLTIKSRAIDIEVLPSPDEFIYVDYSYPGAQPEGEFPQNRHGHELTLDADEFMKTDRDWKFDVFQSGGNFSINAEDPRVVVKVPAHIQIVNLKSISGALKAQNLKVRKLVTDAVSGNIRIPSGQIDEIEARSVSGDLRLEALFKQISAKTVSGRLRMKVQKSDAGIDCETTSGDVRLSYASQPDALLSFHTMSGQIRISAAQRMKVEGELENYKMGTAAGYIKIKTVSGDARVGLPEQEEE